MYENETSTVLRDNNKNNNNNRSETQNFTMENLTISDPPPPSAANATDSNEGAPEQQTLPPTQDSPTAETTTETETISTDTPQQNPPQQQEQPSASQPAAAPEPEATKKPVVDAGGKIDVLLKAAGDAPIMKKKKWAVEGTKPVAYLTQFIKKYIKCEPHESLFLYVNQTFCPSQDQLLSNLFECFGSDGKLILHYCKSQAWG